MYQFDNILCNLIKHVGRKIFYIFRKYKKKIYIFIAEFKKCLQSNINFYIFNNSYLLFMKLKIERSEEY